MDVTVILSNFGENERISHFCQKSVGLVKEREAHQQAKYDRAILTEEARRDIPMRSGERLLAARSNG